MPEFAKGDQVKIVISQFYPEHIGCLATISNVGKLPGELVFYYVIVEGKKDIFACPGFCLQHYPVQAADRTQIWLETGYLDKHV